MSFRSCAVDVDLVARGFRDPDRNVPENLADLSFERAHASLACVVMDDLPQRLVVDACLLRGQPICLELARHKIAPGNLQLLFRSVASQRR